MLVNEYCKGMLRMCGCFAPNLLAILEVRMGDKDSELELAMP